MQVGEPDRSGADEPRPAQARSPRGAPTTRGRWAWRDRPGVVWLLAVVVIALVHRFVPGSRWLMVHMLLLGAATHSILVWSRHFADALLKTRPDPDARRVQTQRLAALHTGVVLVVLGVPTQVWGLTLVGALLVGGAEAWHGIELAGLMRAALPSRFGYTVRYYVAASAILPVGVTLGAWLARGTDEGTQARLLVAHLCLNVLGWIGLTVLGTLSTLWATMLRTRLPDGAERVARRALPVLLAGVAIAALGPLVDQRFVSAAGVLVYLGGALTLGWGFARTARRKHPEHFSTWSVGAGLHWLVVGLAWLAVDLGRAPSWPAVHDEIGPVTSVLAVGFVAQVLLGALSYLLPVVLGGGPAHLRAGLATMGRAGALRVVTTNLALLVCLLPASLVPSAVRVTCSVGVLVCLAAAIPLLLATIRQSVAARRSGTQPTERTPGRPGRQSLVGIGLVAALVTAGVAVDPTAAGFGRAPVAAVTPTGRTTQVTVTMAGMAFSPHVVDVPVGDRLVLDVVNADPEQVHDVVVATGATSGRLGPGGRARVDVGVVGSDLDAWCSVAGHRQMGMTMRIRATGAAATAQAAGAAGHGAHSTDGTDVTATDGSGATAPAARRDPNATPTESFTARDAALPPLPTRRAGSTKPTVHKLSLPVTEQLQEVAPGVRQRRWTFGGTAPGPVLHGRVGDVFEVTLTNTGTIGHSIDFHAGALAPDRPMRTIPPGQSLVYRFTATKAGAWLYHCSTMPMSLHIANGMFGAVIIEPDDLPAVDRSYAFVQSELYLGAVDGEADPAKVSGERPDLVAFNGYADQYGHRPLPARVGERVRLWVVAAGPNRGSAFHVVGGQFDTVYLEGAYRLRPEDGSPKAGSRTGAGQGGSQVLGLAPAQGGFVELTFPEAGNYPFVTHAMVDAERGARGVVRVTH